MASRLQAPVSQASARFRDEPSRIIRTEAIQASDSKSSETTAADELSGCGVVQRMVESRPAKSGYRGFIAIDWIKEGSLNGRSARAGHPEGVSRSRW